MTKQHRYNLAELSVPLVTVYFSKHSGLDCMVLLGRAFLRNRISCHHFFHLLDYLWVKELLK